MKAVIFDGDGTLVDNMMVHHKIWHRKLNRLGLRFTLEETMEKAHGVNIEFLRKFFGDKYSYEELENISNAKEAEYREAMRLDFPVVAGAQDLIKSLHTSGTLLAIGSAGPPENVNFVLEQANIKQYLSAVYHSKNVAQGKPNPEVYLNGARDLQETTTYAREEFEHLPNVVDCIEHFEEIAPATLLHYYKNWRNGN